MLHGGPQRSRSRPLWAIALVTVVAALAGCGDGQTPDAEPGSPENPLVAVPTETASSGPSGEAQARSEKPGYEALVGRQSSKSRSRFTPCNLVSRAQAQAILGGPVQAPVEAPQGPTCIYRSERGDFITLAVQSLDFGRLKKQVRRPEAVAVSDRMAYCGIHGKPILYVSLERRRVLSVAAPCPVARQFAARAVARLEG